MLLRLLSILSLVLSFGFAQSQQDESVVGFEFTLREDTDSSYISFRSWDGDMPEVDTIILEQPPIHRESPNDIKKRYRFEWTSRYCSALLASKDGLILDGMNHHGFSASLMFLDESSLPDRDKEHIPIAASMIINFFIDHFNNVDTAMLAAWDIRIFEDEDAIPGWPFRIILHDSTGSTVIIEHIDGNKRIYTPDPPALTVDGSDYARLLTLAYINDSLPLNQNEETFIFLNSKLSNQEFLEKEEPESMLHLFQELSNNGTFIIRDHTNAIYYWSDKNGEIRQFDLKAFYELSYFEYQE